MKRYSPNPQYGKMIDDDGGEYVMALDAMNEITKLHRMLAIVGSALGNISSWSGMLSKFANDEVLKAFDGCDPWDPEDDKEDPQ
jgi:hypothetical protein